jgi:hypothetical protein
MSYNYPLNLSFKILALAQQASLTDADGRLIFYVRQKFLRLVEAVTVFGDAEQTRPLYYINADRMLDISARYNITDVQGLSLGALKRHGLRSLWRSHYDILDGETPLMTITEENPWVKVLNGIFEEIPVVGMLSGYVLHPAYLASRTDGMAVMRLEKQPAFFEGKFIVENKMPLQEREETLVLLSLLMMILLERVRG